MHEDLFPYYESELLYLRQAGLDFAEKYPAEAGALKIGQNGSTDPHVERLLEGAALMGSRIRKKLDDEFPEFSDALLHMLCPHMAAPIPPVGIIQFQTDQRAAKLSDAYTIPKGTALDTAPVGGTACRFQTVYPVELIPAAVKQAKIARMDQPFRYAQTVNGSPQAVLTLGVETVGGAVLGGFGTEKLRFHLNGTPLAFRLYELFLTTVLCGEISWRDSSGTEQRRFFRGDAVTPAGFDPSENMLPVNAASFDGYRLIHEFFAFQEKFLFVDLTVPQLFRGMEDSPSFEIRFFLSRMPGFVGDEQISANNFLLGCTPVINLFTKRGEPFKVNPGKREYRIIPEYSQQNFYEVHAVKGVTISDLNKNESRDIPNFYAFRHPLGASSEVQWYSRAELGTDGALEHYIQFCTLGFAPAELKDSTVSIELLCSNRDQAANISWSSKAVNLLMPKETAVFGDVVVLQMNTESIRTPLGREDEFWNGGNSRKQWRGAYWRLISHFSLNYLSIQEGGIEALRALLQLYDIKGIPAHENIILGLTDIQTKPMGTLVNGAYCRGISIEITVNPERFGGSSYILLTALLDIFFSRYAAINSVTRLTVLEQGERRSVLKQWPIRAGRQTIL